MDRVILKLYVSGRDPAMDRAATTFRSYCETATSIPVDVEVVDILEAPEIAEANRILATPVLVKESPPPVRKVIGDISDVGRVARFLGIPNGGPLVRQGKDTK